MNSALPSGKALAWWHLQMGAGYDEAVAEREFAAAIKWLDMIKAADFTLAARAKELRAIVEAQQAWWAEHKREKSTAPSGPTPR